MHAPAACNRRWKNRPSSIHCLKDALAVHSTGHFLDQNWCQPLGSKLFVHAQEIDLNCLEGSTTESILFSTIICLLNVNLCFRERRATLTAWQVLQQKISEHALKTIRRHCHECFTALCMNTRWSWVSTSDTLLYGRWSLQCMNPQTADRHN